MRFLIAILGFVWLLVLGLVSLPFIFLGMGYEAIGDQVAGDRWMDRAPVSLWWDYVEARRG